MADLPPPSLPTACDAETIPASSEPRDGKEKRGDKGKGERRESSPLGTALFWIAWIFLLGSVAGSLLISGKSTGQNLGFWAFPLAGARELLTFLSEHLVSAMVPAFFLASAISTFFSKETLIKTMGRNTSPFLSYPLAAFAGAILTVCSCGVLPIFMSILQSGAGLGPSTTFLFASPAINLISLIYTWKILPSMLAARIVAVAGCAIGVGFLMSKLFPETDTSVSAEETSGDAPASRAGKGERGGNPSAAKRTPLQEWAFFGFLVFVMLTSTDLFSFLTDRIVPETVIGGANAAQRARLAGKLIALGGEILALILILRAWFTWDETRKWLKRTGRQAREILPMVFLGIFYSGFFGGAPSMVDHLGVLKENTVSANLLSSILGSILYFGSIVGVNIVQLFRSWGMHPGPALALLLAGPTISLPSILAMLNIVGRTKALAYAILVMAFSAMSGLVYGWMVVGAP